MTSTTGSPAPPSSFTVHVYADTDDAHLRHDLRRALAVDVVLDEPRYDAATDQLRWPYWVKLTNTADRYTFHLTYLERRIRNFVDLTSDGEPSISYREFDLDVLRASLALAPGKTVWFPCAETVDAGRGATPLARSGVYTVQRTYSGDVALDVSSAEATSARFVPVAVRLDITFAFPDIAPRAETDPTRPLRRLEWVRIGDRCESCRSAVMCEGLAHESWSRPGPDAATQTIDLRDASDIHVAAGFEKIPAEADANRAPYLRTVACTRWSPVDAASPAVHGCWNNVAGRLPDSMGLLVQTDAVERDFSDVAPFLILHHAVPLSCLRRMNPGRWRVEVLRGEVVDDNADLDALGRGTEAWDLWRAALVAACRTEVLRAEFDVPAPPAP